MGANLRISHVVVNGYKTQMDPERHSRLLLAGTQIFLNPWTPAKSMRG
jgi:hypothetical protein